MINDKETRDKAVVDETEMPLRDVITFIWKHNPDITSVEMNHVVHQLLMYQCAGTKMGLFIEDKEIAVRDAETGKLVHLAIDVKRSHPVKNVSFYANDKRVATLEVWVDLATVMELGYMMFDKE